MVGLMYHSYAGDYRGMWMQQVTGTDDLLAYKHLKLWTLGMSTSAPADKEFFDERLSDSTSKLTPSQISEGDAWAADTYQRYFSDTPDGAHSQTSPCQ